MATNEASWHYDEAMKSIKFIVAHKNQPDFTHEDLTALTSIAQVHLLAGLLQTQINAQDGTANLLGDLMKKLPSRH